MIDRDSDARQTMQAAVVLVVTLIVVAVAATQYYSNVIAPREAVYILLTENATLMRSFLTAFPEVRTDQANGLCEATLSQHAELMAGLGSIRLSPDAKQKVSSYLGHCRALVIESRELALSVDRLAASPQSGYWSIGEWSNQTSDLAYEAYCCSEKLQATISANTTLEQELLVMLPLGDQAADELTVFQPTIISHMQTRVRWMLETHVMPLLNTAGG